MSLIKITDATLNANEIIAQVLRDDLGGIDIFIGTVRNQTKGKKVVRLEYEAYRPMALSEMNKIANQVREKWPQSSIAIHHRIGILNTGEAVVVIAVATPHRQQAFEACKYAIDTLKETVPIWKKEVFDDGEVWVAAHP